MSFERAGQRKFAELVTDHIFGNINRDVLLTVMNRDSVTDKFREYGRRAGPGLQDFLFALLIHCLNAAKKALLRRRAAFSGFCSFLVPPSHIT